MDGNKVTRGELRLCYFLVDFFYIVEELFPSLFALGGGDEMGWERLPLLCETSEIGVDALCESGPIELVCFCENDAEWDVALT